MKRAYVVGTWLSTVLLAATAWGLSVSILASAPPHKDVGVVSSLRGAEQPVVRATWGSERGDAGRSKEGEPRGPLSFAVDDRKRVWLLDQENGRMTCYDHGTPSLEVTLPDTKCQDLTTERDRICVLSQGEPRRVHVFDDSGVLVYSIVVPSGLPPVLRVLTDRARILVECPDERGRALYDIGSLARPEEAPRRGPGPVFWSTPLPAGRRVRAHLEAQGTVVADVEDDLGTALRVRADEEGDIRAILDVSGDRHGSLFVTTVSGDDAHERPTAFLTVRRFDERGELAAWARCVYTPLTDAARRVVVTASGEVYRMDSDPEGVRVVRWRLEPVETGDPR